MTPLIPSRSKPHIWMAFEREVKATLVHHCRCLQTWLSACPSVLSTCQSRDVLAHRSGFPVAEKDQTIAEPVGERMAGCPSASTGLSFQVLSLMFSSLTKRHLKAAHTPARRHPQTRPAACPSALTCSSETFCPPPSNLGRGSPPTS